MMSSAGRLAEPNALELDRICPFAGQESPFPQSMAISLSDVLVTCCGSEPSGREMKTWANGPLVERE